MNKNWTDVIKTSVPQYPLSGYGALSVVYNSADEQELVVAGYASPQVVDREKHLITKKALADDLPRFLAHPHYRNAMLLHSNVQVGEVLPSWTHPETGERWETKVDEIGLFAVVKVRTDQFRPTIVDKVIEDIQAGKIASFSISADAPFESRRYECVDGACFWIIDAIEYYEITLCETPVNQDANFTILTKSVLADEFAASAFCQDGSCPISNSNPVSEDDRMAYKLRKAAVGNPFGGGPRGNGVADPVAPIPAAKPKEAKDPRHADRAQGQNRAGGNAGIAQVAKTETGDLTYALGFDQQEGDEETNYANRSMDGDEYYLNKTGLYAFTELESLLERAIDELDLGVTSLEARLTLAALQKGDILKGFSYVNKSWVVWGDSLPSAINKDFTSLSALLDSIAEKAEGTSLWNDVILVKGNIEKRAPLRGTRALNEFGEILTRMVFLDKSLDKAGLTLNRKLAKELTSKGFDIGWVGNAQRSLNNAVEALRSHVIDNAATRLSLSPDVLAALDVLYEDMQAVSDNLGIGRALEKFKVGEQPEIDIINEVALSTVSDVQEADLLLQKVDYDMGDPAQQVFPDNYMVQTGVQKDEHSESAMLAWFLPPEVAGQLAIEGGEAPEELHVTFAYFPDKNAIDPNQLIQEITQFATMNSPLDGKVGGVGRFNGKKDVCYASVDVPKLPAFRSQLLDNISAQPDETHGYVPHITLAYLEENEPSPVNRVPEIPIVIDTISVVIGGNRQDIPLGQGLRKAIQNKNDVVGFQNIDVWAPKKKTEFNVKPTGDAELDTVMSGVHNPVAIEKNYDFPPTNVETPVNKVDPNAVVQNRSSNRPEFDTRGGLKAGDEDAKQLALGLGRIFHRTINDARYKLAIVKDEDGSQRIIDLGY